MSFTAVLPRMWLVPRTTLILRFFMYPVCRANARLVRKTALTLSCNTRWARKSCKVLFQTLLCTCGERTLLDTDAQGYLPTQVKVRSSLGLGIGNPIVGLQQQGRGQKVADMPKAAGRDTRSPIVGAVELGKLLVSKQLAPLTGQKAVEGISPHIVEVQMVRLKYRH